MSLFDRRASGKLFRLRTHCKLCRHAIGWGDPTSWLTDPMGLSHEACAVAHVKKLKEEK